MSRRDLLIGVAAVVVAGPVRAVDDGVALISMSHPVVGIDYALMDGDRCVGSIYCPLTGAIEVFEIELPNQESGLCLHAHS